LANQPTTISWQAAKLAELKALEITQKSKTKEMRITLTGKLLFDGYHSYIWNLDNKPIPLLDWDSCSW